MHESTTDAPPHEPGAFAPLAQPGFRWLWPAVLVSYIGIWGQGVGAQWLLVNGPNASVTVALVQTAVMLPMMLFTLPAGVLADRYDRRWIMLVAQVYVIACSLTLAALTAVGLASAPVVLAFTFLLGLGGAAMQPSWQATLPEVVPREELGAAMRLEGVGINFGRAIGPALAGLVIAAAGVPWVFVLTAFTAVVFGLALVTWKRPPLSVAPPARERFIPALRAGVRYVRHDAVVRRILLRAVMFIAPGAVLWALIPLVARELLHVSSGAYGLLFGALGAGAILAALTIGRLRTVMSTNTMLLLAGLLFAAVVAVLVLVPSFALALVVLVLGGAAWATVIATLNTDLQVVLPVWVRARGLSVFLVTFTGSQAVASFLWGQLAASIGVVSTFLVAAGLVAVLSLAGLLLRMPDIRGADQSASPYWGDVALPIELQPTDGPILVTVEYTVPAANQPEFIASTAELRHSRLRSGAIRWELYRVAEDPEVFIEAFQVGSWEEHQAQHRDRLTVGDQRVEQTTHAYSSKPPTARHLVPPF
ncbi:MAG: MFS transporter [Microbacterium sp.]|uniref:MFS transporter n=1 Tax=Microbacterium sp. TaxID=51671 RepID=UPI0039E6B25E